VISDLLEHIPPHQALELWTYPTFTSWDVRFTLWLMSYSFRKRKAIEMGQAAGSLDQTPVVIEEGLDAAELPKQDLPDEGTSVQEPGEVGIGGLGVGRHWGRSRRDAMEARGSAVNSMLEGYYPIVRRAVAMALVGRLSLMALLLAYAWTKYSRSRA
jgi:hypothetical protein